MKLTIHRGTHEIGGSCVELESEGSRIILDMGMPLPEIGKLGDPFEGSANLLPKIKGLYSGDKPEVNAVFISHAHKDHYGFAHFVHPKIPVYMSEGTAQLFKVNETFLPDMKSIKSQRILHKWEPLKIGKFTITGFLVDHSAPDALALSIEAEGKRIFYSGDFRAHGRKEALFRHLLKSPPMDIDYLLLEGTMLSRGKQKFPTEKYVEKSLIKELKYRDNIVFLFCSSQNIDRIVSAYRAAKQTNSLIVIDLYTAYVLDMLSCVSNKLPQPSWEHFIIKYWKSHADQLVNKGYKCFLYELCPNKMDMDQIIARKKRILWLVRANTLFTKAVQELPSIEGIKLIWSMWPGYLTPDNIVSKFAKENNIDIQVIHTSGHATTSDLKKLADALQPKAIIPIHTEYPNLYDKIFPEILKLNDSETATI